MYDVESIKQQFKEVIEYSQGIPDPNVESLFARWEKAKERFITRFGGLIYEWPEPIEFVLDPKEKLVKAREFINCVNFTFSNGALAEFLDLNIDSFFENKVSQAGDKNIPEGMKLIKSFKYFENNKQALRDMQDIASQLIQEDKIKGTLCFSVHPLDFLSSSENTYNWRSCHALDGEYRAGNLSYMVDNCTFMVYLKGADGVRLPAFPDSVKWNTKKWRMLIHSSTDDEIMFAGRQYPFSSATGINTVLNIYNNIFQQNENNYPPFGSYEKYRRWHSDYVDAYESEDNPGQSYDLNERYLIYDRELIALSKVVKESYNTLNYNDVLRSTCYKYPYYTILNPNGYYHSSQRLIENPIWVGEEVTCLCCGNDKISISETMRCMDCEMKYGYEENDSYGHCECCGCRIYFDDAYYVNDYYICDHCFNNECFLCEHCGEAYYNTEKHCVEIEEDEVEYVCSHCYENYRDKGDY